MAIKSRGKDFEPFEESMESSRTQPTEEAGLADHRQTLDQEKRLC